MKFYKMNGLANNFYVFDLRESHNNYNIKELFDLTKLDFDQLINIKTSVKADCFMEIYNIDGNKVEACGNATRCVAKILCAEKKANSVTIETTDRILKAIKIDDDYQVNMGNANLDWRKIPLLRKLTKEELSLLEKSKFSFVNCVNIGNPHIIFLTNYLDEVKLDKEVSYIEKHKYFPEGININIAEIIDKENIRLKTWERGAGATKACGTGACATFYAIYKEGLIASNANLIMPGGELKISLNKAEDIFMQGDANLEKTLKL